MIPPSPTQAPQSSYIVASSYASGPKQLPASFPKDAIGTDLASDPDLGANCSNQILITNDHQQDALLRDLLVCSSASSDQAILVQAKRSYSAGLCFFPLKVNNPNDITPIPNSVGDPASACAGNINSTSDEKISFASGGFNAVMIVEAGDRALARDCIDVKLSNGPQPVTPACPAFTVIQFAQ